MKLILDDTNPNDAEMIQILGAIMTRKAANAAGAGAQPAAKPAPERDADGDVVAGTKPKIAAVPEDKNEEPTDAIGPEVDADGVEWDPELHASTKTKTAAGRWKKRKGAGKPVEEKAEAKPTATGDGCTFDEYREAVVTHKGKFGIDRTKEILKQTAGVDVPSAVTDEAGRRKVTDALNSDKGPDSVEKVDIDDFC